MTYLLMKIDPRVSVLADPEILHFPLTLLVVLTTLSHYVPCEVRYANDRRMRCSPLCGNWRCRSQSLSTATGVYFTSSDNTTGSVVTRVLVKALTWQPCQLVRTLDRFSSRRVKLQLVSCLARSWIFCKRWPPSLSALSFAGHRRLWLALSRRYWYANMWFMWEDVDI